MYLKEVRFLGGYETAPLHDTDGGPQRLLPRKKFSLCCAAGAEFLRIFCLFVCLLDRGYFRNAPMSEYMSDFCCVT